LCYNISTKEPLTAHEAATLTWLLRETYEPELLTPASVLDSKKTSVVEVGDFIRI
jgi:phosphoribosylformylglycinamidine synthase